MADLTAIILTRNEEDYIAECIESIKPVAKKLLSLTVLVMIKLLVLHKKQEQKYISTSFTIMRSNICMQLKLQT